MKTKRILKQIYHERTLTLMALPMIVYFILFKYMPMFGNIVAFKDFSYKKGFLGSKWVGFENFEFLFKTQDAYLITRNTLLYNLAFIFIGTFLAVCLAIIFDLLGRSKLNRVNQTLVLFPYFISWVVGSYFVAALLDIDKGLFNRVITAFGGSEIHWYTEKKFWPYILFVTYIWKTVGYNAIIYYSNIKGFDAELYEAAKIDGANWFKQVVYITVPLLKSIVIIMVILAIGSIFHSDFGLFYLVPRNSGALYSVTSTIDTYVYNGLMNSGNIGMSAATGLYQSMVGFILVLTTNTVVRKFSPENAMF